MELPFLSSKKEPGKNYVALKITLQNLSAALWQIDGGKVVVGKIQTAPVNNISDLLPASDKIISEVTADILPEPKDILFGLPPDWVESGKIADPYSSHLKKLCQELGFSPLGFVTIPDAIVNFLKEAESAPLTAILVGLELEKLFVTVIRAGKNLGTQTVAIPKNGNVNEFLEAALKKFTGVEILPSRILIYDGRLDLEKLREQIMAFPWTQKLPFLHFPKVEILDTQSLAKAVAVAGGTELGGKIDDTVANVAPVDLGFFKDRDIAAERTAPPKVVSPKISFKLPKIHSFAPLLAVPAVILFIIISFLVFLNFGTKAKATLYVTPKVLEEDKDIAVVTSGDIKENETKILGSVIEVDETDSKRTVTTGRKLVGTKAKGSATLYSTTIGKSFPAGTVLVGPNSLRFILDSDVAVASGSAASPATAPTSITAVGIGESYNLGSGSLLSLADYPASSYQAKNDSSLTGGTSRQAQVVVAQDNERLVATLSAQLTAKSADDLRSKLSAGQNLLDKAITGTVTKQTFDRTEGDEADSVGLTLSMHFTGVIFDQEKLVRLFGQISAGSIPGDYIFSANQTTAEVLKTTIDKKGSIILTTHFVSKLLPKMDNANLTKNLAGKNFSWAKKYLLTLPGVVDATVTVSPPILNRFGQVPRRAKNISLDIVTR